MIYCELFTHVYFATPVELWEVAENCKFKGIWPRHPQPRPSREEKWVKKSLSVTKEQVLSKSFQGIVADNMLVCNGFVAKKRVDCAGTNGVVFNKRRARFDIYLNSEFCEFSKIILLCICVTDKRKTRRLRQCLLKDVFNCCYRLKTFYCSLKHLVQDVF